MAKETVVTTESVGTVAKTTAPQPAAEQVNRYRVTYREVSGEYQARDEAEAWAKFNDAHKTSYGPKTPGRQIELLK